MLRRSDVSFTQKFEKSYHVALQKYFKEMQSNELKVGRERK
jgi:hypothetical protein